MKRRGVAVSTLGLVACFTLSACPRGEAPANSEALPAKSTPPTPATPTPTPATPEPGTPAAPTPTPGDAAAPATPPSPTQAGEWGERRQEMSRPDLRPVTLREVRAARNEGFDRVVFQFDEEQVPGYRIEYLDSPAISCGSGEPVTVAGEGRLQVTLLPAQAHANGQSTLTERARKPALPLLAEMRQTCDFEGEVTWVLGVSAPHAYRVLELKSPTRLVVDVRH
jgi:type IV secretory pathway VirB10-like protein